LSTSKINTRDAANSTSHGLNDQSTTANNSIGQNNKQSRTQRKRTIEGLSDERPTPHPNRNGLNERNSNDEEQPGEGRVNALGDTNKSNGNGVATDTISNGGQKHTGSMGCEIREEEIGRDKLTTWTYNNGPKGDVADTDGIRLRRESNGIAKSRFINEAGEIGNWHNFPTKPPICSRNDGLSSRLDGITFSKWRNESIKAGGNAIVPQVVYQIFKAIEQYEKANSN
jgi:DNA (cytosine-5)-methyltransferase 1